MNNEDFVFISYDSLYKERISSYLLEKSSSGENDYCSLIPDKDSFSYFFFSRSLDKVIGEVQLRPEASVVTGNIGYRIRPSMRGLGYGVIMVKSFLDFLSLGSLPFVFATCLKSNTASVKTALACGGKEFSSDLLPDDYISFCFRLGKNAYIFYSDFGNIPLETSPGIFSPKGPDKGTVAMLSSVSFEKNTKILDLGCGSGIVGIYASKATLGTADIYQSDISAEALEISGKNAQLNNVRTHLIESAGFDDISEYNFDLVISNPPYHTDFSVAKNFIEKGFYHIKPGGRMVLVTKRLDWYKNKLTSVFGGVKIIEKDGYFIFISEKRSTKRPGKNH